MFVRTYNSVHLSFASSLDFLAFGAEEMAIPLPYCLSIITTSLSLVTDQNFWRSTPLPQDDWLIYPMAYSLEGIRIGKS